MSLSARVVLVAVALAAVVAATSCKGGVFGKQYEYEEDLYLALDGSATLIVNASVPALVALRGIDLDLNPATRNGRRGRIFDRERPTGVADRRNHRRGYMSRCASTNV